MKGEGVAEVGGEWEKRDSQVKCMDFGVRLTYIFYPWQVVW